jgi:hypothetical protein
MKYEEIRENIKSGDLLGWSHRGWKSFHDIKIQLVRFFTQSEYSHVGTAWVIGSRVFVIEAVVPLVRIYPLSKLESFYWVQMNASWYKSTEARALEKVGYKYSEVEALRGFLKLKMDTSTFQCAELAADLAEMDGINLGDHFTPSAIMNRALLLDKSIQFVQNNV